MRLIIGVFIASLIGTWFYAAQFSELLADKRDEIFIGFYASLVEDIVFFSVVGLAVYFVTAPRSADDATYEERLLSLYGNRCPEALRSYARQELKKFGGFTEAGTRTLTFEAYDADLEAFRVRFDVTQEIRNLFDVEYSDKTAIAVTADFFDAPPARIGEMLKIELGGRDLLDGRAPWISPNETKEFPIDIVIGKHDRQTLEYSYRVWLKAGELNSYRSPRVAEKIDTNLCNALPDRTIDVRFELRNGGISHKIGVGECKGFPQVTGLVPGKKAFIFTL